MEISGAAKAEALRALNELVVSHYGSTGQGLLLAQLGKAIRAQGIDVSCFQSKKLSDIIKGELKDSLTLVHNVADPKIVSVIPVGKVPNPPPATDKKVGEATKRRRISRAIWLAFTRELDVSHRRYITLDPPLFVDVLEDAQFPGGIELPATLIVGANSVLPEDRDAQVLSNIESWVSQNRLDIDVVAAENIARPQRTRRAILEQMLEALTEDQQRRTSLPLDVVAALLRG